MRGLRCLFIFKLGLLATFSGQSFAYIVQKGDTLSEIAQKITSDRIYGKSGFLLRLLALNPHLKSADLILPGQRILIDEETPLSHITNACSVALDREIASTEEAPAHLLKEETPVTLAPSTFRRGALIGLTPYFSFLSLSSKDRITGSPSTMASSYNAGAEGRYVQEWSESFQSAVSLGFGMVDFERPTRSTRSLSETQKLITKLGLHLTQKLSDPWHLELSAEYGKELFARAMTTQVDTVDVIHVPSIGAKVLYDFLHLDPFVLGVSGTYETKMPTHSSGYNAKLGHEFGASIFLKQSTEKTPTKGMIASDFRTELGFYQRRQNTTISTQTETNFTLGVSYFFPVGRKQGE